MRFRYKWLILFLIIILGATLRFFRLGEVPASLNADEVANGYNAYSILKTGKDEYGQRFPYLFQSFDDYKLPVYVYLTVPSVAVFGLNDFSVRFPSALFGTLTVLATYFLVKELFSRTKNYEPTTKNLPITATLLLTISPWHLQFSRSAYEANIAVFFTVLGMTCLLRGSRQAWFYIVGFIWLSVSVWSYHSSRIFVPLILVSYTVLYFRDVWKNKLVFFLGMVICIVSCLPLLFLSFSSTGLVRARGVSALDDPSMVTRNVSWRQTDIDAHIPFSNIFHNHRLVNLSIFIKGYLDHYNPNFFFSEIVQAKYHAPGVGLLYLWELPFLLYGIFSLLKIRNQEPGTRLLLCWFLFAPLAASATHMLPHPVRTLTFLPTPQIFVAIGVLGAYQWFSQKKQVLKAFFVVFMSCIVITSCLYYLHQYYIHMRIDYALDWQYGHEQVVEKVRELEKNFNTVVVSTSLDQPYIFFLYYLHYDPATYLASGGTKSGKFDEERNAFFKYEFRSYMKADVLPDPKTLYVGTPSEILPGTYPLVDIKDPSGNSVYMLYSTLPKAEWNKSGFEPYLE